MAFVKHFAEYVRRQQPKAVRTVGSSNVEWMKMAAGEQEVLSFHSYALGDQLKEVIDQARQFGTKVNKPVLLTEGLANTDNWLKIHGEESRSSDEGQLRHYQEVLPIVLESGIGWYSWGFVAGQGFTPFTDILYSNGYRRPAAVYLEEQLRGGR